MLKRLARIGNDDRLRNQLPPAQNSYAEAECKKLYRNSLNKFRRQHGGGQASKPQLSVAKAP